jgi:hypothetical protein
MILDRYETACGAIDKANAEEPSGHELQYSRKMVEWIGKLAPDASPELLLAGRAQHIRRWTIPRSQYPEGRASYLRWRETLKTFHAGVLETIMREAGFELSSIEKARSILIRKNLAPDAEGQTLEDAACLVFLEFEFEGFIEQKTDEKIIHILRKTWLKMSPAARECALKLPVGGKVQSLMQQALA